jgi:hypothetical protein
MRQRWYSLPSLFGLGAITFFVVLGFFTHTAFWLAVGITVVWVWYKLSLRIEVTSTDVVVRQWPFPKSSASREAIKVMHWFGRSVTFVDDDHRVLLKIGALGWAGGQLLDLSEALGVHLYNHRTQHGFGTDASKGQLMQRAINAK